MTLELAEKLSKKLITLLIAAIFGLVLILVPVTSQVSLVQAAINWTEYSLNPVLEEGDPGDWDEGGVGAACVIQDGSTYKMWYTGLTPGLPPEPEIGYATSENGTSWSKYGANPVLTKGTSGAWDDEGVGSSCVIWDDDDNLYKMWYTGTSDNTFGAIPAIGYATSSNGISWDKYVTNPVLTAGTSGAWDDAGVLSPCVIKESLTSYKMWYSGRSADGGIGNLQIGYATSTDGEVWTKYGTEPVIAKGIDPDWDSRGVGVGSVIVDGGTYEMWFTGYKGSGEGGIEVAIGSASSSNGISWTKSGSNPELDGDSGWESNGVGAPWVTHSGRTYRLWYSGLDTNFDTTLGYASYTTRAGGGGGGGGGYGGGSPRISDVSASSITETSADINWTTNEDCDGQVEYWASPVNRTMLDEEMCCDHLVILTDLTPATTYDFRVMSNDKADNLVISDVYTFTTLEEPATFITSTLNITPGEVDIGETVTISVSVSNTGGLTGNYEVTLKIDDVVVGTEDVTLAGGDRQTTTFTVVEDVAGTYTVNVNSLTGVFMVKAAPPSPSPSPPPLPPPSPPSPSLPPPAESINWWFIGGMIAVFGAVAVITGLAITRIIRR